MWMPSQFPSKSSFLLFLKNTFYPGLSLFMSGFVSKQEMGSRGQKIWTHAQVVQESYQIRLCSSYAISFNISEFECS